MVEEIDGRHPVGPVEKRRTCGERSGRSGGRGGGTRGAEQIGSERIGAVGWKLQIGRAFLVGPKFSAVGSDLPDRIRADLDGFGAGRSTSSDGTGVSASMM